MAKEGDMQKGEANWEEYFDAVKGLPARETLVAAAEFFTAESAEKERGRGSGVPGSSSASSAISAVNLLAVDLGCGEGRDTVELLRRGWRVVAVDSSAEAIVRLRARVETEEALISQSRDQWHGRLETVVARFEDVAIPACDLVNASFSIPHCSAADFPGLWAKIVAAIRPGGRFAGQFFGVRDGWAQKPDGVTRTYHTREEVEAMLGPFEVEMLDEIERPGKNALGVPKYWHVFHVVARKKAGKEATDGHG